MVVGFSTAALGIYLWMNGAVTPGAIGIVMSLAIRLTGMSHWIMWEISSLFENIGTVQDGINTISVPQTITDADSVSELKIEGGEIQFKAVQFAYNNDERVFDNLNLTIAGGEKVGIGRRLSRRHI